MRVRLVGLASVLAPRLSGSSRSYHLTDARIRLVASDTLLIVGVRAGRGHAAAKTILGTATAPAPIRGWCSPLQRKEVLHVTHRLFLIPPTRTLLLYALNHEPGRYGAEITDRYSKRVSVVVPA